MLNAGWRNADRVDKLQSGACRTGRSVQPQWREPGILPDEPDWASRARDAIVLKRVDGVWLGTDEPSG